MIHFGHCRLQTVQQQMEISLRLSSLCSPWALNSLHCHPLTRRSRLLNSIVSAFIIKNTKPYSLCKVSAAHQALRVFSYLGRPSSRSIQAMVLIGYFLMNDNHAADTWAFAGILIRHAYALGLNRDPSLVVPNATPFEKQQRRKLWQAVLLQDTFLTVILKLPPTATHNDVRVEDLQEEVDPAQSDIGITDISYISSMWNLANLVQQTICSPRSLSRPIAQSPAARKKIIEQFTRIYMSFPLSLRTFTESSICELANKSRRPARQTLFLTSNYFHCLMLINLDEHENLEADIHGTLNAAHDAINSFFLLHKLFEEEARVWYHFQHRAFSEAVCLLTPLHTLPWHRISQHHED